MPSWEPHAWGYTFVPNPFWGGVAFPLVVFGFLFLWPTIERRVTGDDAFHHLLDRPRDVPWRTATGVAAFVLPVLAFLLTKRLCVELGDGRRRTPASLGSDRSS